MKHCHSKIDDLHVELTLEQKKYAERLQERNTLEAEMAALRQHIKKQEQRISELANHDETRNELKPVVDEERAVSDDKISMLTRELENIIDEREL